MAARTSPCAPVEKLASLTTPSFLPLRSTSLLSTSGTSIRSRLTLTVRGLPRPAVTWRVTLLPAGPLIRPVATRLSTPASERPLTAMIRSPLVMPALRAGDLGKLFRTRRPRRSSSTVIPTPSNSPSTAWANCWASSGGRYWEKGSSSASTVPFSERSRSFSASTGL